MRKLILNKWFIVASLFALSLTALSFVTYKKARAVCAPAEESCKSASGSGDLFWDAFTLASVSAH